jgi:hypothetical protein
MINEKVAKYLDGVIAKRGHMEEGETKNEIIAMMISKRKETVLNIKRQMQKEEDEIEFLLTRKEVE